MGPFLFYPHQYVALRKVPWLVNSPVSFLPECFPLC